MFYIQGEVISNQLYHLVFILFGVSLVHSRAGNGKIWEFFPSGRVQGAHFPKRKFHNISWYFSNAEMLNAKKQRGTILAEDNM